MSEKRFGKTGLNTRVKVRSLVITMAVVFTGLFFTVLLALDVFSSVRGYWERFGTLLLLFALVYTEYKLFTQLDRTLDDSEELSSRFGRDFKGDYKSSPGPYGQGLRGIGGKILNNDD